MKKVKESKDIIGIVGQYKIYPEPVAPISEVGLKREWDVLIECWARRRVNAPLVLNGTQNECFLPLGRKAIQCTCPEYLDRQDGLD